jgi:hypothetical protein
VISIYHLSFTKLDSLFFPFFCHMIHPSTQVRLSEVSRCCSELQTNKLLIPITAYYFFPSRPLQQEASTKPARLKNK